MQALSEEETRPLPNLAFTEAEPTRLKICATPDIYYPNDSASQNSHTL